MNPNSFTTRFASAALSLMVSAAFFAYAILPASPDFALAAGTMA